MENLVASDFWHLVGPSAVPPPPHARPHLVITETVSTIQLDQMADASPTTTTDMILDTLASSSTTEVVVAETTATTTIRVATEQGEEEVVEEAVEVEVVEEMVEELPELGELADPLAACAGVSACVVYLVEDGGSRRAAWLHNLIQVPTTFI